MKTRKTAAVFDSHKIEFNLFNFFFQASVKILQLKKVVEFFLNVYSQCDSIKKKWPQKL